ncbi:hypothetical protein EQU24_06225 [Methylotuvimicrobium buryatense]|uniref:Uncharacterized protein n=1 Tax=Methylotuvimicrobium buryatense TaxID=95641 RepID=A0A4P9UNU6_METBY|nr:hypothetical protein EQU24_06225 [Methylotuvimicrobium buryatense]
MNAENAGAFFCPALPYYTPSLALSCRQAPMDGFTAFLDRHTPHPKIGETAQTGNCCPLTPRPTPNLAEQ